VISASLYLLSVFGSAFSAKPSGSQNPIGGSAPGIVSSEKALTAVDERPAGATGAKAAAEPMNARAATDFMVIYL